MMKFWTKFGADFFWRSFEILTKSCSQTELWFFFGTPIPPKKTAWICRQDPSPSAGKGVGWNPWDYSHLGRTGGWESGWLLLWRNWLVHPFGRHGNKWYPLKSRGIWIDLGWWFQSPKKAAVRRHIVDGCKACEPHCSEVATPSIRPCWRSMLFWNKSKSNY